MTTVAVPRTLQGIPLYALLVAIALAAFLVSLDGFIVNVAIPTISGELGVREDIGTWIITVFTMANTLFVPISGKLATRFGNRPVFVYGMLLFCLGSVLCGLSHNFSLLLAFRVVQGAGAGLILPVSLSLIITHFPEEKRSVAVGFWSFFAMVGPAMGPMIGGWLSDYHWHWLFFVNLPISIFILTTFYVILGSFKVEKGEGATDWIGVSLLFLCMGTLQVALNRGQINDWFRSPFIITLFVISSIAFAFFIVWELFQEYPIIELTHFKKRNFTLACFTMGSAMGLLFSSFVLDSLWVQEVLGYTPAWAGLTLTPVGVFPLLFYPILGRYITLMDLRIWVIASFLLLSCTFFWLSNLNIYVSFWQVSLPRLVQGIGFPMFTIPNALLAVQGVDKKHLTSVISFFSFFRLMCVALGVPLATTLWIHREAFYQSRTAEQTFITNPNFTELLSRFKPLADSTKQTLALTNEFLVAQDSTLGLCDIYYAFAWIFLGLCLIVPFYKLR